MGLKAVGTFLEAPETGTFNVRSRYQYGTYRGRRWRAKEKDGSTCFLQKGFWEGGVVPNICSDI